MSTSRKPDTAPRGWKYVFFIVPAAHTEIFNRELQSLLYEAFHTTPVSRFGHALCTPVINILFFSLGGLLSIDLNARGETVMVNGIIILVLLAQVFYLGIYGRWALCMAPLLGVAGFIAARLYNVYQTDMAIIAPVGMLIFAFLQTFSHSAEPLPPPWSGNFRFKPLRQFLREEPVANILLLAMLSITVYPLLELWAAFRIWPLQLAQIMRRYGLLDCGKQELQERVRAVHTDTRNGWT